jgi:hemerythrin-like domain-containing protein
MPDDLRTTVEAFAMRTDCSIAAGNSRMQGSPRGAVADWHAVKLELCNLMEAIADSLPERIDQGVCLRVATELLPVSREAHIYEEAAIFPAFVHGGGNSVTVSRLRAEHFEDETLAEEVTEALLQIGHGGEVTNPEALGFMLRALFQNMRRHIAFEREHVAPQVVAQNER